MNKLVRLPILLATMGASLALCASANAAVVTVGSSLEGPFNLAGPAPQSNLVTNTSFADSSLKIVSPVSGVVVRWRLFDAEGSGFQLYSLSHGAGNTYTATGSTPAASPLARSLETFPAALPINAGEAIGLLVQPGDSPGVSNSGGDSSVGWAPALGLGETKEGNAIPAAYGFNAEVQPAPTISAISPTSGSVGTMVMILGTDFEGASAVRFGSTAAASFTVNSEGQIRAVAPPAVAGPVNVSVTTIAGTATSSQQFTYLPTASTLPTRVPNCTVPKLTGKKLKAARKGLAKANCKLGKVTKKKGATAKTGKVVKQSPKAGKVLPARAKVGVKLG